jgi:hypothetical protein
MMKPDSKALSSLELKRNDYKKDTNGGNLKWLISMSISSAEKKPMEKRR